MKLEITKARRKCHDCEDDIEKGAVVGVSLEENQFGTKKVSFCKLCTIKGLLIRKKRIDKYLKILRSL